MVIIFTISAKVANGTNFISVRSVQGILTYATQIVLIGMGETLIMIAVGIDMSSGYMLGLSSVISAEIMKALYAAGVHPILTILLGMIGGILICIIPGWINGWLVARIKVPSFIATLGVDTPSTEQALVESEGYPVAEQPPYLGQLGNGFVLYYWPEHGLSLFKNTCWGHSGRYDQYCCPGAKCRPDHPYDRDHSLVLAGEDPVRAAPVRHRR